MSRNILSSLVRSPDKVKRCTRGTDIPSSANQNNLARHKIDPANSFVKKFIFQKVRFRNSLARIMKCLLSLARFTDHNQTALKREKREIIQVRYFSLCWVAYKGREMGLAQLICCWGRKNSTGQTWTSIDNRQKNMIMRGLECYRRV